jgi:hypothetical protein
MGIYPLVHLGGEGKGGFNAGRILWHPPFVNAGSHGLVWGMMVGRNPHGSRVWRLMFSLTQS